MLRPHVLAPAAVLIAAATVACQTPEPAPDVASPGLVPFGSRPRVVRGLLPARPGADRPLTHGLVVGLPNGFALEYRTDDLTLLRTFVGAPGSAFVDRPAWRGDHDAPLELRAAPLDPPDAGSFGPAVEIGTAGVSLRIELRRTDVDGDVVRLSGDLVDGDERLGTWSEELRAVAVDGGVGFHRRIELRGLRSARLLRLRTAGLRVGGAQRFERRTVRGREVWYAAPGRDGVQEVLAMRGPQAIEASVHVGIGVVVAPVGDRPFTRIDVLRLRLPAFDRSRVDRYAAAFDPAFDGASAGTDATEGDR